MKQKLLYGILALSFSASLLNGCGAKPDKKADTSENEYQKIELVMAVNGTDNQIDALVADKFAELVAEASDGNVTIAVFPNDQLAGGNATKGVEMVAVGGVDLAAYASCVMQVIDTQLSVATIPWAFDNYEQAKAAIDQGGGDYYAKRLAEKGITYLGSFHNGFRQITNNKREIASPEDVDGLKIRVPGNDIYMGVFRTLGADPVAMNWSECFTSLQQGAIDGQENGVSVTNSSKMYEVQKYLTMWNYSYENDLFVANTEVWNSLEKNTKELLSEKVIEACEWGRDRLEAEEFELVESFRDKGMQVKELSEDELQNFKDAVADTRQSFIETYGEEACSAFGIK